MTISKNPKLLKKLKEREFVDSELCEANKLLLNRMQSNPDEFHLNKGGKWADYLNMLHARVNGPDENVLVMLSHQECVFMWEKYCTVAKDNLHKTFMKRIISSRDPEE
jgi:hypothetical protein